MQEPLLFPNRPATGTSSATRRRSIRRSGLVRVDIPPIAVTGSLHRAALDAKDGGQRDRRRHQAQTDVRLLPRLRRRRGPGLGRRLAGDDRQPALLRRAPRKRPPGRWRTFLRARRSGRRHRHLERLHRRYAVSPRDDLPARFDAGSGLRAASRSPGSVSAPPWSQRSTPSASRTSAPCAGTRSPRRAKAS